jgi:hypothetical protein
VAAAAAASGVAYLHGATKEQISGTIRTTSKRNKVLSAKVNYLGRQCVKKFENSENWGIFPHIGAIDVIEPDFKTRVDDTKWRG